MADKDDKTDKKEPAPKAPAHGIQFDQSFVDWMVHRMMDTVLPWGLGKAAEMVTTRTTAATEKPGHLISFGEALTKLRKVDQYSYDVINDFMRTTLVADADRSDFQVRTAKMGGTDADVTVAFLQLVANEPDHEARMKFLETMGLIGERAIDPLERAQLLAKQAGNFLKTRGRAPLEWIAADLRGANTEIARVLQGDNARLQAELDRRRGKTATPPPANAPTGNRLTRAWRALRGQ